MEEAPPATGKYEDAEIEDDDDGDEDAGEEPEAAAPFQTQQRAYAAEDNANALLFRVVCDKLEKIEETVSGKGKSPRRRHSKEDRIRLLLGPKLRETLAGHSAYPYFRLLLPGVADPWRPNYGIKEATMARLYASALGLAKDSDNALKLVHYTDARLNPTHPGDLPSTVEEVAARYANVRETALTVGEVNALLDDLAAAPAAARAAGRRVDAAREAVLQRVVARVSARDQKWLLRAILKQLKQRLSKEDVLAWLHADAPAELSRTNDLRHVCGKFAAAAGAADAAGQRHAAATLEVGTPFAPMLAHNPKNDFASIVPSFKGAPFLMEVKLDGERMLAHKDGDAVRFYTRRGTDYTDKYGPVMTPFILSQVTAHRCILDGEMMSWDADMKRMVAFGCNRTSARLEALANGSGAAAGVRQWLCYSIFDIVYLGAEQGADAAASPEAAALHEAAAEAAREDGVGAPPPPRGALLPSPAKAGSAAAGAVTPAAARLGDLTELPLAVRRRALTRVIGQGEVVRARDGAAAAALEEFFELHAIARGEEGLVVKDLTAPYLLGEKGATTKARGEALDQGRAAKRWIKMKPDYADQTQPMDVVVVGGTFGAGGRGGGVSSFIMAVRGGDEGGDGGDDACLMYTCGCVGSGYNLQELKDINDHLKDKWFESDKSKKFVPAVCVVVPGACGAAVPFLASVDGVMCPTHRYPDLFVHPRDSIVLEVKCAEYPSSTVYSAGFNMRFPRIERFRFDKGWRDADDLRAAHAVRTQPRRQRPSAAAAAAAGGRRGRGAAPKRAGKAVGGGFEAGMEVDAAGTAFVTPDGLRLERSARSCGVPWHAPHVDAVLLLQELGAGFKNGRRQQCGGVLNARGAVAVLARGICLPDEEYFVPTEEDPLLPAAAAADAKPPAAAALPTAAVGGGGGGSGGGGSAAGEAPGRKRKRPAVTRYTRNDLHRMVLEGGGTVVANPTSTTTYVVANFWQPDGAPGGDARTQNFVRRAEHTVLDATWLLRTARAPPPRDGGPPLPSAAQLRAADPATRAALALRQDAHGDSYADDTDAATLKKVFENMLGRDGAPPGWDWRAEALRALSDDDELGALDTRFTALWKGTCVVYVDIDLGGEAPGSARPTAAAAAAAARDPFSPLAAAAVAVEMCAGRVAPCFSEDVTHVVIDTRDLARLPRLRERQRRLHARGGGYGGGGGGGAPRRRRYPQKRFVTPEWVDACARAGRPVEPAPEHVVPLAELLTD
ncbi:ATP dependent DNA ligase domain-containing protein [Tribonema minus]|uniref:DNA ligase IV n=1 Tax=Tribonema minus TaxID=303371 RepID=A0A836CLE3_9STRA|nr:ATP dependent DNA ligase domain-containing protein [Tribonema minus]